MVNILGSFVLGLVAGTAGERGSVQPQVLLFLTVGLCGAFTTMSSFSCDTVALIQSGRATPAVVNVAATMAGCFSAIWLGNGAARLMQG